MWKWTLALAWLALGSTGCVTAGQESVSQKPMTLNNAACVYPAKSNSPWNIKNLYDCENRSLFIPYQLWTGADWDGTKDASCMHSANSHFYVNGDSSTTIQGAQEMGEPVEWRGPHHMGKGEDKRIKNPTVRVP